MFLPVKGGESYCEGDKIVSVRGGGFTCDGRGLPPFTEEFNVILLSLKLGPLKKESLVASLVFPFCCHPVQRQRWGEEGKERGKRARQTHKEGSYYGVFDFY